MWRAHWTFPSEVAKRPDVLVIESGEIELPTKVKGMKSIGLPPNVIYACLAETIVLALEGRFEVFTIGRDTEWEKVKEIYKLGLRHGMKLSAISGVKGVYSDEDIANVVKLAKKARLSWTGSSEAKPGKAAKAAAKKVAAKKTAAKPTPVKTVVAKKAAKPASVKAAPAKAAAAKVAVKKAPAKKAVASKTTTQRGRTAQAA